MSRHRFVKNLTEEDYYDDDYYDEDDYWEEEEYPAEQQGTDINDDDAEKSRKRRRKIQDEINSKILADSLKVKGLSDSKKATSSVVARKGGTITDGVASNKSVVIESTLSKPAASIPPRNVSLNFASSPSSVQTGTTLASLASLSLSPTSGSAMTSKSRFAEIHLESLSSQVVPSAKTLNLDDLLKNTKSNLSPAAISIATTSVAPTLSLSQILGSKSGENVLAMPSSSIASHKITLKDLLKSSTSSNVSSSPIPHSISAIAPPLSVIASANISKVDHRIVSGKSSSNFALFLSVPSSASTTAGYAHSTLLDAIDLTSIPLLDGNEVAFKFTDPSPDDVALSARQRKPGNTPTSKSVAKKPKADSVGSQSKKKGGRQNQTDENSTLDSLSTDLQNKLNTSSSSSASSKKKSKIDVAQEYKKRSSEQESLNLITVGHVDAGKSTMMGHLLVELGEINSRTISKFKKEADALKKGSFMYAWVLDATEDERSRGVTIDCAVAHFTTVGKKRRYTLLDAPGHQDFVEKMVAGTNQADVAILVVDAGAGGFESGFENGGQTREHALLLKALGVGQIIVAVNKMDLANWSVDRYDEINAKVVDFLINVAGFEDSNIQLIPLSGYTGDNLVKSSMKQEAKWYTGPSLVDALDLFHIPKRPIMAPFVLSVQDSFKGGLGPGGGGSVTVAGRIDAGSIQVGDLVLVMPIKEAGTVKAIQMGDESMTQWAVAGDRVSITLTDIDPIKIHIGSVLCSPESPAPTTSRFLASISTFDLDIPLTLGVPIVLHHLGAVEAGTIVSMENSVDAAGKEKKRPRVISSRSKALVTIQLERPISCQTAAVSLELGRFLLRKGKASVAAGLITEILAFE